MSEYRVHFIEGDGSVRALAELRSWLLLGRRALAVDTETTGLNVYAEGFRCRHVVLADTREAYVLNVESGGPEVRQVARTALLEVPRLVFHNATYDWQVLERAGFATLEEMQPRSLDTRLLAHLVDPRGKQDGAVGHKLKDLAAHYVDPSAADGEEALLAVFRSLGLTKETGYAEAPVDHPTFVQYAGQDGILTARLLEALLPLVRASHQSHLVDFERDVQALLARLERKGMLMDVDYARRLSARYLESQEREALAAEAMGVENVNSTTQVAEALQAHGAKLTVTTPSGGWKVNKDVLTDLSIAMPGTPVAKLIGHVMGAKRAGKFRKTYVEACLERRDAGDRVHPQLNSLQARTARMSVSKPPLQQLPSDDWWVRRLFIADPGQLIGAADYSQVELRVLGAMAKEENIMAAVAEGVDLHDLTAERVGIERKTAKMVNFLTVYGGGHTALSRQAHIPRHEAKVALSGYHRAFPGVKRYGRQLQRRAEYGRKEVRTASGRRLPLDRSRLYAATNYVVQSSARDVLAQALLELEDAGLERHLLIPVHDEVVVEAPADDISDVVTEVGRVMSMDFQGVHLEAEGEVYGPSWGHGYGDCVE